MGILDEARRLTSRDRQDAYGTPMANWTRTAAMWTAILGVEVTAEQAVMCMLAVKLAREAHKPSHDTRVDLAGYAEVLDQIVETRREANVRRRSNRRTR